MERHQPSRWFASDNNASVHPEVMEALVRANFGHAIGYGGDPHTERAQALLRDHFGPESDVYFVLNGTGANVLSIDALVRSHEAVICSQWSHLNVDECGAAERHVGCKLIGVTPEHGKLTPEGIEGAIYGVGVEHHVQPRLVSISQATEVGTVYTPAEVRAIADLAHSHDLLVHVDGARLANAAASLGGTLRGGTFDLGVDVVSFGGTKNGIMLGEAVVLRSADLSKDFLWLRKQGMQLASKMRFIAAQFEALLRDDLWLRNAYHSNAMARRLADAVRGVAGVEITQPVDANAVFARLPATVTRALQARWPFYVWDEGTGEVRWMTAWDTTESDVDEFAATVIEEMA